MTQGDGFALQRCEDSLLVQTARLDRVEEHVQRLQSCEDRRAGARDERTALDGRLRTLPSEHDDLSDIVRELTGKLEEFADREGAEPESESESEGRLREAATLWAFSHKPLFLLTLITLAGGLLQSSDLVPLVKAALPALVPALEAAEPQEE